MFVTEGLHALMLLQAHFDITVMLSDINVPSMDGVTLREYLSAIDPTVQPAMITVYGDMTDIRTAMNRGRLLLSSSHSVATVFSSPWKKLFGTPTARGSPPQGCRCDEDAFFAHVTLEFRTTLPLILSLVD